LAVSGGDGGTTAQVPAAARPLEPLGGARPVALIGAAAVGVFVFQHGVGFQVIDPAALGWLFAGGVDPSGHFLGWHMFRHDAWQMPPGAIDSFGHPIGTSIALTDSIPLVAFPLKVIAGLLPPVFQYMGLWLLACFVLQGLFGALLVATVAPSALLQFFGAALFALSPVLVHRVGHQALCAHWLLLAAIWLYVRSPAASSRRSSLVPWLLLMAVVSATHPYLAIQVAALGAAALIADRPRVRPLLTTAVRVAALAGVTMMVWWGSGYFTVGSARDLQDGGLGRLSLNLAAPLIPPPGALLEGRTPFAPLSHEQLEGYSYFGLGALLVLVVALAVSRPLSGGLRSLRMRLFASVCAVLTLLAVSPTVTLDTHLLFQYDPDWWGPLSVFRSSGRLFWLVYYAILFGGIAMVVRRLTFKRSAIVLGLAVLIQLADMAGPQRISKSIRGARVRSPLTSDLWEILPRFYPHLVLYPTNMCALEPDIDYRFVALEAGKAGATINAGYAGRYDAERVQAYCRSLEQDIQQGHFSDDSLYVVAAAAVTRVQSVSTPMVCTPADNSAICFTAASHRRWHDRFDLVRRVVPTPADLWSFRERLETDYRDRMRRPAIEQAGSMAERLEAIASFVAARVSGCDHDESLARAWRAPGEVPPLCRVFTFDRQPLPSAEDTSAARRQVEERWRLEGRPLDTTHVDAEGEAVWSVAYVERRLRGQSHAEATDQVLETIRAIAP
jgi:hypothetical protein